MRIVRIPGEIRHGGDLSVTMSVGYQGFKRTDVYKEKNWAPGKEIWVDEETVKVEFSRSTDKLNKYTVHTNFLYSEKPKGPTKNILFNIKY